MKNGVEKSIEIGKCLILSCGFFVAMLVGLEAWIFQRRSRKRIPGLESLDDPDVAKAFGAVSNKNPWPALMQHILRKKHWTWYKDQTLKMAMS